MNSICDRCSKYPCTDDETKLMIQCPAFSPKPKPMTHFDEIKAMSVEEMACWISEILMYCASMVQSKTMECSKNCPLYKCCNDQPTDNIEYWLKSPADKDGEV